MKTCKYAFTRAGVKEFADDSYDLIFSALEEKNEDFTMDDLDIKITIGNLEIDIPNLAHDVEAFFLALDEVVKVHEEEEA